VAGFAGMAFTIPIRNVAWQHSTHKSVSHYPFICFFFRETVNRKDMQPSYDKNAMFEFKHDSHIITQKSYGYGYG